MDNTNMKGQWCSLFVEDNGHTKGISLLEFKKLVKLITIKFMTEIAKNKNKELIISYMHTYY